MQKFTIQIPGEEIDYLKQRLANARWSYEPINEGWTKGVPTNYLKNLADYWLQNLIGKSRKLYSINIPSS